MKKRILLSLVSFFAMTAMWASITDAYQIYVTGANGKTYGTAELTLNMKNKNAIAIWKCTLVLPEGITYKDVAVVDGRYPEGFNAVIKAVPGNNNEVAITCSGDEGLTLTENSIKVSIDNVDLVADTNYILKTGDAAKPCSFQVGLQRSNCSKSKKTYYHDRNSSFSKAL